MSEFEKWWNKETPDNGYSQSDYDYALEVWKAATEAAKPRWIPVSERLPTKPRLHPVIFDPPFEMEWLQVWFNGEKFDHNYEDRQITRWLELPELPE